MAKTNNTKQALWIAIGQLASTLIAIISPMILSRYLTKMDYGTYKQVMYVYTSLLAIFTLGLPKSYSYFIPRVPIVEARSLIIKITRIFFILGLAFSVFLFVGAPIIAIFLKNTDLVFALRVFSIVPTLLLPTIGMEGVYASFKKTQVVAIYTIITKILTILLTVLPVVAFNGNYIHALIGFDIGCLLTCIVAMFLKSYPVRGVDSIQTSVGYKSIFSFSLPLLIASFWGMIINSSDQFFISRYFGNEVFAEYANGFMEFPVITMIVGSISTVLIPLFSKYNANSDFGNAILDTWKSTLSKSVRIVYPMAFFCIVFSTTIMVCLYGQTYRNSNIYFSIKNVQALFSVLPFSPLVLALGKTKEYSRVHLYTAIVVVTLEFLVVHIFDSACSIAIVSLLCQFLKVALQLLIVMGVLHFSLRDLVDVILVVKCCFICMLSCIPVYVLNLIFEPSSLWVQLFIDCGVFVLLYYTLCFAMNVSYKDIFTSFIGNKYSLLLKFIP